MASGASGEGRSRMVRWYRVSGLLASLLLLVSCHKELCYDHNHGRDTGIHVVFDWQRIPQASPASMQLSVFQGEAQPISVPFEGRNGGDIMLSAGTYGFVGYNSDTEILLYRGSTLSTFEIYSPQTEIRSMAQMFRSTRTVPRAKGTDEQTVIFEPDPLWTSADDKVVISGGANQTVVMPMEAGTFDYTFIIKNVEFIDSISEIAATLSGMSESWIPATHQCSDTYCIIPFGFIVSGPTTLQGTLLTFGHCPGHVYDYAQHLLVIYVQLKNGTRWYYTFDVTKEMHDGEHVPDEYGHIVIPIVIDRLPMPQPINNGGNGLQPVVEDWQEVVIPVVF